MTDENHPIDLDAKEWMKARLDEECERLQANNVRPIPLTPLNCGLFVDNQGSPKRAKSIVNRVELCTNFDFDKVIQVYYIIMYKRNYKSNIVVDGFRAHRLSWKTKLPLCKRSVMDRQTNPFNHSISIRPELQNRPQIKCREYSK